jgi:ArsR family transcriptional regulator, arsenate/arsenite/antimonite-responsive transcriptional repressor
LLHQRGELLLNEMDLIEIYQCFCDRTRLRILQLLTKSPLCVCHFQDILGEPQVKISKHLSYLRGRNIVNAQREQNWMIYSLPERRADELEKNLKCLQDCIQTDPVFKRDLYRLTRLRTSCCEPRRLFQRGKTKRRLHAKTKGSDTPHKEHRKQ